MTVANQSQTFGDEVVKLVERLRAVEDEYQQSATDAVNLLYEALSTLAQSIPDVCVARRTYAIRVHMRDLRHSFWVFVSPEQRSGVTEVSETCLTSEIRDSGGTALWKSSRFYNTDAFLAALREPIATWLLGKMPLPL